MRTLSTWKIAAAVCAALGSGYALVAPQTAEACGGTFCDGGPNLMPVNQSGENVIFVLNPGEVEAHIQISYDPNTNAQKFAWLIPLASLPEFEVGSQPLFDALLSASVPQYGVQTTFEQCGDGGLSGGNLSGGGTAAPGDSAGGSTGGAESDGEGPNVVLKTSVGAFDIVVLEDKTVAPIKQWLIDNEYQWVDEADAIFQQYLDEGNLIAAFKLVKGSETNDVHPIVLRYPSNETCFPLRLTRVGAVEDMDIRVFLLGGARAAPTNYRHVLVNPLKIDWLQFGANYKEVISKAVDELMADGRAFVTEYAGSTDIVQPFSFTVYNPSWNEAPFVGLDATQVINELNNQSLAYCYDEFSCTYGHPLIPGLLAQFLPPPAGVTPEQFYPFLGDFAGQIDLELWGDGSAFSAALAARVIEPGLHAQDLLQTWPYLTRMYTTISPNEMTADPVFHINPDLPEVSNIRIANNLVLCDGNSVATLPDGREVFVPNGGPWPDIPGEEWWAEEIQQVALKGQPMHLVNNTAVIDQKLEAWNLSNGWPHAPSDTAGEPTTGGTGDGPDSATGGLGNENSGCSCSSESSAGDAAWLGLFALGLAGARRRRRA